MLKKLSFQYNKQLFILQQVETLKDFGGNWSIKCDRHMTVLVSYVNLKLLRGRWLGNCALRNCISLKKDLKSHLS